MPVIGNIKGIVEAVTGRVLETGEKLEPWERALQSLGRLGKGINEGAKLLGVADELAGGIRYVTRQAGEVIAGIPAVWENTKENIQEGLGIGWDFIQGAKGAIQEDITMGLLPDRERAYDHPIAAQVGEVTGHTVSTVFGALETLTGLGGEAGSVVLDATGVGAIAGVPGMIASAALAAHGVSTATKGAGNLGSSASDLVQLIKGEGTGNGVDGVTNLLDKMPEFTGSTREKLLSAVQNKDLRKIVSELYRPGATVGDGGTASILTKEFYEGSSTHLQKAKDRVKQLNALAKSEKLSLNDLDILDALIDDLEKAIRLFE